MDEQKLWENYYSNKCVSTRNVLILVYYKWVIKLVTKFCENNKYGFNEDLEDLVSYGIFGLINAIEKYDITKNVKFKTFASKRVWGSVIDNVRKFHFGASKHKAHIKVSRLLDSDLISHYDIPDVKLEKNEFNSHITSKVKELPKKQQKFIKLRYVENKKLKEIAKDPDFNNLRKVHKCRKKALYNLRKSVDKIYLK